MAEEFCEWCGIFGHNARYCPDIVCIECNQKGHIKIDCENIIQQNDQPPSSPEFDEPELSPDQNEDPEEDS